MENRETALRSGFKGFRRFKRFKGWWYRPSGDEFCNSAPRNGKPYNRASPAGRLPSFIIMAPFIFKGVHHRCRQAAYILAAKPPPQPSAAKPLSNLRTLGAKAPSILRTFSLPSEPARSAGGTGAAKGVRVQRVQRVQKFHRVVVSPFGR